MPRCLTAATTITDIARTTRHFDKKSFCHFLYPIYGMLQSAVMEMVIMNGSAEYAQDAKKALNDTLEELRSAAENANYGSLKEIVKELECIMMIANGNTDSNHFSIPFPLVLQMLEFQQSNNNNNNNNNNNSQNLQKSSSTNNNNNNSDDNNKDNNTSSNSSTTNEYLDDDFMERIEFPNSSCDNLIDNESNSPIT